MLGKYTVLIRTGIGLGDILMLSCVAAEYKKQYPKKKIITLSRYPELFDNNPNIWRSYHLPKFIPSRFWYTLKLNNIHCINYENIEYPPKKHHILELCCLSAGLKEYSVDLRPEIFLTDDELQMTRRKFKLPEKYCVIHSECGTDWFSGNKDWGHDNWQKVVNKLKAFIHLVQVGASKDKLLEGCLDLRGKTSIRELAAVINQAKLFLGQEGGLGHIAGSLKTKGMVVIGGLQPPELVSYTNNFHFTGKTDCSPCWLREKCPYNKKCMDSIKSDFVVDTIIKELSIKN